MAVGKSVKKSETDIYNTWFNRFSDSIVDTRDKDLLDICIGNKLRIVNSRTLGDSIGKYTCYKPIGCSVIDYLSENLSKNLKQTYITLDSIGFQIQ
jgi:hypothetical protein